jgi:hypothetical protein
MKGKSMKMLEFFKSLFIKKSTLTDLPIVKANYDYFQDLHCNLIRLSEIMVDRFFDNNQAIGNIKLNVELYLDPQDLNTRVLQISTQISDFNNIKIKNSNLIDVSADSKELVSFRQTNKYELYSILCINFKSLINRFIDEGKSTSNIVLSIENFIVEKKDNIIIDHYAIKVTDETGYIIKGINPIFKFSLQ